MVGKRDFKKAKIFWGLIVVIILSFFIFYFNCSKNPTKYQPIPVYLYVSNTGSSAQKMIYVISTETDSFVDSIYLGPNIEPGELALSPDKTTLYVTATIIDTMDQTFTSTRYEVDTRTKAIKYIGPNSSTVISPDGKYLFGAVGRNFTIFDACTHQIVYQESTFFSAGCFDSRNFLVYGGTERKCRVFNYKNKTWVKTIDIFPNGAVISPDGEMLYFLELHPYYFFLDVYDLRKDSLVAKFGINSPGQLAIKPDGNTLYITDPGGGGGCISIEPPPTGKLGVFDMKTNTPLPSISLDPLGDSFDLKPSYIRITPDGKKAYLSLCLDRILVIDLVRNEPLKGIIYPGYRKELALFYIAL